MKILRNLLIFFLLILIIYFIVFHGFGLKTVIMKKIYPQKYAEYVNTYAEEYNVDPLIVFAIIKAESNFNPEAKSHNQAQGLMQLMESTAEELTKGESVDLYDAEINIKLGTCYFANLLEKYNYQLGIALAAYNAGMGNVNTWIERGVIQSDGSDLENIPYKETNMYVRKILNNYQIYKELYQSENQS